MNDWLSSFELVYKCTKFIDLHFVHFKMVHQTLANNESLYRWKLIKTDLCSFCNEEIETIYHTYLECEVTKHFWQELESYIYRKYCVRIPMTNEEIILGLKGDNVARFTIIYLLAKKYLYQCRCNNTFPVMKIYLIQLRNLIDIEKGIYTMNNMYDKYLDRWGELATK